MTCAVVLLLGATGSKLSRPKASDATAYHQRVYTAAESIPLRIGDWVGTDHPLPIDAINQLQPNVVISRRLRNVNTGYAVDLLLVQCRDVRDLAPHYPPVCYPGQGLVLAGQELITLQMGNLKLPVTRYTFESNNYRNANVLHVDNVMVLPDGGFQPDMRGMERRIGADERYFGAAQIQIIQQGNLSESDQTNASQAILRGYKPLIDAILDGVRK